MLVRVQLALFLWSVRLAWGLTRRLVPWSLMLALWPLVLTAYGLRRGALPALEGRWPGCPWRLGLAGLGAVVLGLALLAPQSYVLGGLVAPALAPLLVAAGALPAGSAAVLLVTGAPVYAAGGVLVAALWPAVAWLRARVGAVSAKGAGGKSESGHRTPDTAQGAPPVVLKPVSAQRIATTSYGPTRFYARALEGPELLSMCCGPAGAGKSEFAVFASTRAAYSGETLCGLETTKPRRTLLLSEMGDATLQPALRRWGLYAETTGLLDGLRLRLFLPAGHPGATVDVAFAADIYKPVVVDGELRQAAWPAVIEAIRPLVEQGRYDRIIVDSLAEWLGSDGNDAMLKTLGACRQLTHIGAGVLLLHHTPRSDPYRPRGGTVIEAKLDVGYSVTGFGAGGMPRSRQDPAREIRWFKTRFPDHTPTENLAVERVWTAPLPGGAARYQLQGAPAPGPATKRDNVPLDPTVPVLTPQAAAVRDAFASAGAAGATVREIAAATGIARQRVNEAVGALIGLEQLREGEKVAPPKGGTPTTRYYAVDGVARDQAAARLLHEALDA